MLTSPVRNRSSPTSQGHDWEPVVFVPFDETTAYERLDAYFKIEADRLALSEASGIHDIEMLDALIDAGFDAENLPALRLAPIAFVAWASDTVTDAESQAAVWSIYESRLFEFPDAASRVQAWLDVRPQQSLWDLWLDYTQCRLQNMPAIVRQVSGKQMLEQATAVALASGGFKGVGSICAAEKMILDSIRSVYRI